MDVLTRTPWRPDSAFVPRFSLPHPKRPNRPAITACVWSLLSLAALCAPTVAAAQTAPDDGGVITEPAVDAAPTVTASGDAEATSVETPANQQPEAAPAEPAGSVPDTNAETEPTADPATASDAPPADDDHVAIARPTLPTPEEIQKQIAEVNKNDSLSAEEKTNLLEPLQATLDMLTEAGRLIEQRKATAEAIQNTPAKTQQVKKQLEQFSAAPPEVSIPSDMTLEELRAAKAQADAELAAARQREAALVAKESDRSGLKTKVPKQIAERRSKIQALQEEIPAAAAEQNPALSLAKTNRIAADIYRLEQQIESLLQSQREAEAEAELLPAQIKLVKQEVARQQAIVQQYAQVINARRSVQLENMLERYRQELAQADVRPENSIIDRYDDEWMQIVRDHMRIAREGAKVDQRRKLYEERKAESDKAIEDAAKGGRGLGSGQGLKLQRERLKLPTARELEAEIAPINAQIEWARAFQADVENAVDMLVGDGMGLDPVVARETLMPLNDSGESPAWSLEEFREREVEMLRELVDDIETYIFDLMALRDKHEEYRETVISYRELIDQYVMWIRSDRRYGPAEVSLAWSSFQWMVHPQNLAQLGTAVWSELFRRPDGLVLWLLIALGWAFGGAYLRRRIKLHRDAAIRGNQVLMRPTMQTLAATISLAALPALFFAIPGWRIYRIPLDSHYVQAIGLGLLASSALLFPVELIRQIIRRDGLGLAHFGWKEAAVQPLRAAIRCTTELMLVLTFFWTIAANSGIVAIASSLGRPLFAGLMVTISFALWRIFHPRTGMVAESLRRKSGGWLDRLRYIWHPAISAVPIGLGIVSLLGFRYSAERLTTLLYETLWLGIGLVVLHGLLRRWVMLSRRRLLLQQIRERAEAAEKQAETDSEEVILIDPEAETIDITDVNAQTLRLIQAFLVTLAIVGLFKTWSAVLPALTYLQGVPVPFQSPDNEEPVMLANLLLPIPIIVLTIIAWRNVPGLLETALLQRLPLDNATRYAITTLSSYALLLLGIVLSAAQFGLRWDNIQWLVAALGVGLGFGLQEIFANFISGIILLFEQPLRVGDVVTLGDTTGVVSRIRIRATTITNWDRQELIIPNKDLITGRLINWTLTDSTNRMTLNVGIAYGSDTRKACAILEEICAEHENTAEDPPPIVTFESFGDSTLNLVIRFYLNSMAVRLTTIHELHTTINERFREEGIEIAFPQRDLNIRMVPKELTTAFTQQDRVPA